MSISTLLVANRGEIACRVMRTAKALGIRTVAVYSDADRTAKHVLMADDAIHIGPSPVAESYLVAERILDAAKTAGADAIHPGYGFLSENAEFAKACEAAGVTFIGPSAHAIDVMGDKARAKRAMIEAGVPCVPGYQGEDQSDATLVAEAKDIGLPVMVKAAAGGGGRGMRLVLKVKDLANAIKLARSEAENAFGSGELIIEKAIQEPRHVEIQVFADTHGNTIHLGERDCSVQRRHQKVLEEAPCPVMTDALRAQMGEAAVNAAKAVDYRGAGTVEFLLDKNGAFYFLEMNTRLQVEHPVTEEVTGLDLVALQIAVAEGAELGLTQDNVTLSGHAIEARIYAEDPAKDFLPSTGPVHLWSTPLEGDVRVDDGISSGDEVSPFYDAMVAKVIVHGATRKEALRKLNAALRDTTLFGFANNRDFLLDAINQDAFQSGAATTAFIDEAYGKDGFVAARPNLQAAAAAAILDYVRAEDVAATNAIAVNEELSGWSSTLPLVSYFDYQVDDETFALTVSDTGSTYSVSNGVETLNVLFKSIGETDAHLIIDGKGYEVTYLDMPDVMHLSIDGKATSFTKLNTLSAMNEQQDGGGAVTAPMHGMLLDVLVKEGDAVKTGDKLATLEAMKMQHEITAEIDGTVSTILASPGVQISANDLILEIEQAGDD